jgi:NDP-sugar pyrophosphorylase family protein
MKKRVSLTIEENLIKDVDRFIDGSVISSRSEIVEKSLENFVEQNTYVVILAGGDPKKLLIPQLGTYRPLVDIGGKLLIESIIENVRKIRYKNIIIVSSPEIISEMKRKINNEILKDIIFIEEKIHKNTANTLSLAREYLKCTFLFLPCDHFFTFDLNSLKEIHAKNKFVCTLAIYAGVKYIWNNTAAVDLNGNEIKKYWEFPKKERTLLTSAMIGFCEPEIFNLIDDKKLSLQNDVFPILTKKRQLGGALLSGVFVNVHTKKDVNIVKQFNGGTI